MIFSAIDISPYKAKCAPFPRKCGDGSMGVYRIVVDATGDTYIGSAGNMRHRVLEHVSQMRRRVHPNKKMQAIFDTFGPSSFRAEILFLAEPPPGFVMRTRSLVGVERHLIVEYRPSLNSDVELSIANGRPPRHRPK